MTRIAYLVTSAREMTLADGTSHPTGYALDIAPADLDSTRFTALVDLARTGDPAPTPTARAPPAPGSC